MLPQLLATAGMRVDDRERTEESVMLGQHARHDLHVIVV